MIVIADSNIFYSALIAPNGEIANILRDKNMQFIAPDFIIDEVKEHLDIIEASRKKDKTTIIPLNKINDEYLQKAFTIIKDIDEDDYPFIALHLQIKHKIWSRDQILINGLTAKGYGHFFITTEQMKKYLYKK